MDYRGAVSFTLNVSALVNIRRDHIIEAQTVTLTYYIYLIKVKKVCGESRDIKSSKGEKLK